MIIEIFLKNISPPDEFFCLVQDRVGSLDISGGLPFGFAHFNANVMSLQSNLPPDLMVKGIVMSQEIIIMGFVYLTSSRFGFRLGGIQGTKSLVPAAIAAIGGHRIKEKPNDL